MAAPIRSLLLAVAALAAACRLGPAEGAPSPSPPPAGPVEAPEPARGASEAAPPAPRRVLVAATGDLLVHRRVRQTSEAHGGFEYVLAGLASAVRQARALDPEPVTLVNMETPLTEAEVEPVNRLPPVLGAPPEVAPALRRAGVDLVSLANNHALDQRAAGLLESLSVARGAGLGAVGAGASPDEAYAPWVAERGGLVVAFVGFARFVNEGTAPGVTVGRLGEEARVEEALAAARRRADVVVAAVHWSSDWEVEPAPSERRLARRLVEWGADVIVGTGPHVLMEVERLPSPRGEAVVAYSVGNLVSNQGLRYRVGERPPRGEHPVTSTPGARDGVLLLVEVAAEPGGPIRVESLRAIPMWTENNFWAIHDGASVPDDVRVVRLADADAAVRDERSRAIAAALGPEVQLLVAP